jgi:hypothetical protein
MTEYYNCVVILVITAKNIFFRYLYISDFQSYITSIEIAENFNPKGAAQIDTRNSILW